MAYRVIKGPTWIDFHHNPRVSWKLQKRVLWWWKTIAWTSTEATMLSWEKLWQAVRCDGGQPGA